MPVPKRKRSRTRRDKRFANKGLDLGQFGLCLSCETPIVSHQACKACGFYKGRKIMVTKNERAEKRAAASEDRKKRQEALEAKMQPQNTGQQSS